MDPDRIQTNMVHGIWSMKYGPVSTDGYTYEKYYSSGTFFPYDLVLAQLSDEVYNYGSSTSLPFGWCIVAQVSAPWYRRWKYLRKLTGTYYGKAFFNNETKQLVIAHKGTSALGDVWADLKLAFNFKNTHYTKCAYNFSLNVINKFSKKAISVSITGHSLGGYLAQTTALYLQDFAMKGESPFPAQENTIWMEEQYEEIFESPIAFHAHVVAFDSPGAGRLFFDLLCKRNPEKAQIARNELIEDLDITVYISKYNIVNTCNGYCHVGKLYFMKGFEGRVGCFKFDTHGIHKIIQYLKDNSDRLKSINVWKTGIREVKEENEVVEFDLDSNVIQWSVFTDSEKQFLKLLKNCYDYIEKAGESWAENFLKTTISLQNYGSGVLRSSKIESNQIRLENPDQVDSFIFTVKYLSRFEHNSKFFEKLKNESIDLGDIKETIYQIQTKTYMQQFEKYELNNECVSGSVFRTEFKNFIESNTIRCLVLKSSHAELISSYLISILKHYPENRFWKNTLPNFNISMCTLEMVQSLSTEVDLFSLIENKANGKKYLLELLIVDCSKEDTESVENCITKDIKKGKKLIIIIPANFESNKITRDTEVVKVLELNLYINYENLSEDAKARLGNSSVVFCQGSDYGLAVPLRNIFTVHFDSFEVFLSLLNLKLGKDLPRLTHHEEKYYIDRKFKKIVFQYVKKWFIKNSSNHLFFVDCKLDPNSVQQNETKLKETTKIEIYNTWCDSNGIPRNSVSLHLCETSEQHSELKKKNAGKCFHYLSLRGDECEWLRSSPVSSSKPLYDAEILISNEKSSEISILETQSMLNIIIDEPGMGKTTTMKKLALEAKKAENWIIFVDLKSSSIDRDDLSLEMSYNFLYSAENIKRNSIQQRILGHLVKDRRVVMFLDGFDEITVEKQEWVVKMCKQAIDLGIQIFLTSREHAKARLDQFQTVDRKFVPLSELEQIQFLKNYFENLDKCPVGVDISKFVTYVLDTLKKTLESNGLERFIGIPLSLYMLAVVCTNAFRSNSSTEDIPEIGNILTLFQRFIQAKYSLHFEKIGLKKLEDCPRYDESIRKDNDDLHMQASLCYLSDNDISYKTEFAVKFRMDNKAIEQLLRVGLVSSISANANENLEFIHRTIPEYFVALYISKQILEKHEIVFEFLKDHYFKDGFSNVRKFIDLLLASKWNTDQHCCDRFMKVISGENRKIEIQKKILNCPNRGIHVDALGRRLLHYVASYGDHEKGIYDYIIEAVSRESKQILNAKDKLGLTFGSYACDKELNMNLIRPIFGEACDAMTNRLLITRRVPEWDLLTLYSNHCGFKFRYDLLHLKKMLINFFNRLRSFTETLHFEDNDVDLDLNVDYNSPIFLEISERNFTQSDSVRQEIFIRRQENFIQSNFKHEDCERLFEHYRLAIELSNFFIADRVLKIAVDRYKNVRSCFTNEFNTKNYKNYFIEKLRSSKIGRGECSLSPLNLKPFLNEVYQPMFQHMFAFFMANTDAPNENYYLEMDYDFRRTLFDEKTYFETSIFPSFILADYLLDLINRKILNSKLLLDLYFNKDFTNFRRFFDGLLAKQAYHEGIPIFYENMTELSNILTCENNDLLLTALDKLGRTPLHYISYYYFEDLQKNMRVLSKFTPEQRNKRDCFGLTFHSYAFRNKQFWKFFNDDHEDVMFHHMFGDEDVEIVHDCFDFDINLINDPITVQWSKFFYRYLKHLCIRNYEGFKKILVDYFKNAKSKGKVVISDAILIVAVEYESSQNYLEIPAEEIENLKDHLDSELKNQNLTYSMIDTFFDNRVFEAGKRNSSVMLLQLTRLLIDRLDCEHSDSTLNFIKLIYSKKKYLAFTYLLDLLLAKKSENPWFMRIINAFRHKIEWLDLLQDQVNDGTDLLGRTPLHYIAYYGDYKNTGILDFVLTFYESMLSRDKLGFPFLSYAVSSQRFVYNCIELGNLNKDTAWLYNLLKEPDPIVRIESLDMCSDASKFSLRNKALWIFLSNQDIHGCGSKKLNSFKIRYQKTCEVKQSIDFTLLCGEYWDTLQDFFTCLGYTGEVKICEKAQVPELLCIV